MIRLADTISSVSISKIALIGRCRYTDQSPSLSNRLRRRFVSIISWVISPARKGGQGRSSHSAQKPASSTNRHHTGYWMGDTSQ